MTTATAELFAQWGERKLPFRLVRQDRQTLRVTVSPDGGVSAYVPLNVPEEEVIVRVSRRGGWIVRQLQRFEQWRPRTPPRQYVGGETHLFLGQQYRLRLDPDQPTRIYIDGDRLVLAAPKSSTFEYRRAIVRHWFSIQAHRHFPARLKAVLPPFDRLGVIKPRLIVRRLVRRWGSYTPAGALVLNSELVQASPHLIDYVVAHELAHAVHPNHGAGWQALLDEVMPDWRDRKAALEMQLL